MDDILELEGVGKRFQGFALEDVTFSLPRGAIMGFVGKNGAGKTTTIKIVLGLVHKDQGTVRLFGEDHLTQGVLVRERIGFVSDENMYYEHLTPAQVGGLLARFYRQWDAARFRDHLKAFDLPPNRKIKHLSRGMKVKLGLAAALSHGAELVVMDEPTSGLDPVFRAELLDLLTEVISDERRSILFSSHITADVEKIADYVTLIDRGRIVLSQTKDDVVASFGVVKGPTDKLDEARPYLLGIRQYAYGFEALCADRERVSGVLGPAFVVERASIDDILVYTGRYGTE